MSERDLKRIEVLSDVRTGHRTVAAAAAVLSVSERQAYRLLARYEVDGGSGLIHKARGKTSNRSHNDGIRKYADFGPPLATEALSALALYLVEWASGLPFFSPSPLGSGGIAHLFGPTGGYLLAYPLAAGLVSYLTRLLRQRMPAFAAAAIACTAATTVILTAGVSWIALAPHVGLARAFTLGALPFLPGQAIKIVAAAGIYATLKPRKA